MTMTSKLPLCKLSLWKEVSCININIDDAGHLPYLSLCFLWLWTVYETSQNMSHYAKLCQISELYFTKKFRENIFSSRNFFDTWHSSKKENEFFKMNFVHCVSYDLSQCMTLLKKCLIMKKLCQRSELHFPKKFRNYIFSSRNFFENWLTLEKMRLF